MTIRDASEIKKGLVAKLKSKTNLTTRLKDDDADNIKEAQWQGTDSDAGYPGVRVKINSITPFADCNKSEFGASIYAFSEEASSKEADEIAGIILTILHRKGFTSTGIAFYTRATLIPAIRQDERTWRSEVVITGQAS